MKTNSKITQTAYYLPDSILTNKALEEEFSDWDSGKLENKIGIVNRHISGEGETAVDLAEQAAIKLFKNYDKTKIDFLILCTQSPDYILPTSACILQARLGLSTTVGAFDYNLGCSGFIYGLAMAKGFIVSGIAKNILLITAETYSKYIHSKDRSNRSIFGDAATATVISANDNKGILDFALGTDGSGADNLIIKNGGARNHLVSNAVMNEYQPGSFNTNNHLYMNGPEIFNFTIKAVPKLVKQVLEKNNYNISDIDYTIFHQANKFMLNYLRKKLKIAEEKFYINLDETGNTVSATIPIALYEAIKNEYVKKGDKVLLVGFGVGYSYGAIIIEI
jgi:3-oxoacyl-[acyl-carrier-protein] synthase III